MDRPEPPAGKPPQGSWVTLMIAAMVGMMILTALVMLTGGFLGLVILVAGGVFAMAGFHYLVWGWWLTKRVRENPPSDEYLEPWEAEFLPSRVIKRLIAPKWVRKPKPRRTDEAGGSPPD